MTAKFLSIYSNITGVDGARVNRDEGEQCRDHATFVLASRWDGEWPRNQNNH